MFGECGLAIDQIGEEPVKVLCASKRRLQRIERGTGLLGFLRAEHAHGGVLEGKYPSAGWLRADEQHIEFLPPTPALAPCAPLAGTDNLHGNADTHDSGHFAQPCRSKNTGVADA